MRRFLLIFIVVELGLLGVELLQPVQQHLVLPFTTGLAHFCAWLVTLFDASAASVGKVLWNPKTGFGVSIEPGCNGVEAMITLFAAIVAFPSTWKHRLLGFVWGTIAIQALNVVRVISLFYLGQWNTTVFMIAHEYLWQALIMLDVLVVWLIWVRANPQRWGDEPPGPRGPPAAATA
jgi:exosortase H (IPTLxxWG-CTERM-specific)